MARASNKEVEDKSCGAMEGERKQLSLLSNGSFVFWQIVSAIGNVDGGCFVEVKIITRMVAVLCMEIEILFMVLV